MGLTSVLSVLERAGLVVPAAVFAGWELLAQEAACAEPVYLLAAYLLGYVYPTARRRGRHDDEGEGDGGS